MCGICGYINLNGKSIENPALIKEMTDTLSHRGPDDQGYFIKDSLALGHRRLSVIDLETGHQPLFNQKKNLSIIYNGEAYNFHDLKAQLIKKGYIFNTASDTEVVLYAYQEWGKECFEKINGMFAIAIWDENKKELILARDRFGKKPLYYAKFNNLFIFASEIKAILKHPQTKKELNKTGLFKYLAYDYIPNPHTIFKNIYKLPPAHYAIISDGKIKVREYWDIKFDETSRPMQVKDYKEDLLTLLKESVKRRLISDVPLGVFLSGGLDSSSVVAMMAELMPAASIKTFTIGFKEKEFDESGDAKTIAKHFKTDHYQEIVSAGTLLNALPEVLEALDEPFADYSIIPTYVVSRFARKHVTVALGGDGGDEFFAGYPSFVAHKISRILKHVPLSSQLLNIASGLYAGGPGYMSTGFKIRRYLRGMSYPEAIRHQVWIGSFPEKEQRFLLTSDFANGIKPDLLYDESYRYAEKTKDLNYINRVNYLYAKTYMTDDILTKVDRASMAVSLEVRAPFLDPDFINFATSIPSNLKLKGFTSKYILKEAMKNKLPRSIIHKTKHGFAAPVGIWFRKELKNKLFDIFDKKKIEKEGIFSYDYINNLLTGHINGKADYSREIWSLFVFHLWYRKWFKGEA